MANTKRRKKKKKVNIVPIILAILLVLGLIIAAIFVFRTTLMKSLNNIVNKAEDFLPNAFSFPSDFDEYVIKYSNEYDVDANFVYAVIKVESNYDPKATSNVGARGLMQLMEDAYDWIKYRLDDQRDNSYDDMYDPELNIQYGTYYLSYLMDKYDNSIELSAAAYHCGMSMVDGWLEAGTIDAENFDVKDIPEENDQTSYYVTKIQKAYEAVIENKTSSESSDI